MPSKKNSPVVEQVRFNNGNITLAGELYRPPNAGKKLPLLIQVHGSGRQGRHAGPWNTFVLQQGIAVLSYDKRGVGASGGQYASAGYADLASDLLAAIAFAKNLPGIDSTKIGLHASSEGGWVASIAAAAKPGLAFMLVRAGSGVSGSDTYMHEVKIELKEKKLTEEEYRQAIVFEQTVQDMAARNETLEAVNAYIHQTRKANAWFEKAFGNYHEMNAAYYIKLKQSGKIDPVDYLRKVNNIPVLWFLAEEDENVPYKISLRQAAGCI